MQRRLSLNSFNRARSEASDRTKMATEAQVRRGKVCRERLLRLFNSTPQKASRCRLLRLCVCLASFWRTFSFDCFLSSRKRRRVHFFLRCCTQSPKRHGICVAWSHEDRLSSYQLAFLRHVKIIHALSAIAANHPWLGFLESIMFHYLFTNTIGS